MASLVEMVSLEMVPKTVVEPRSTQAAMEKSVSQKQISVLIEKTR